MLKVNGITVAPKPSQFNVGFVELAKYENNANGEAIIEIIATKSKLDFSWNYLSNAQLTTINGLMSSTFFTVTYPDPDTGLDRTATFYKEDRKYEGMFYENGSMKGWRGVSFTLRER